MEAVSTAMAFVGFLIRKFRKSMETWNFWNPVSAEGNLGKRQFRRALQAEIAVAVVF